MEIMEMHGISKEGLPRVLGGTWSYDYGRSFVSSLEREERMRYAYFYGGTTSTTVATDVTECVPVPDEAHSVEEVQQLAQDPLIQSWKAFMEQTLKHEIPDEDKEAYLEAAESIVTSSDIRNRETNIDWFLQAEDFHSIYAAKRYVRYWQLRSETFGPNRFKPLHQTGEGALGRIELNVLATTFLTLLPSDAMGRPVLSIDSSMLKTGRSARDKGRDRCLFYMFSILAENEQCRRSGVVVLFRMESQFLERIDIAYLARIAHSLPLHMEAFHIVSSTPVPASLKTAINFCDQVFVHDTGTWEEITTNLEKFGMRKENLPKYIGGGYGLAKILQWQELRTRLEFQLPLGMSAINTSISDVPGMGPYTELSVEDKTERRRRFNVLNCRRKRDRIRIERELLEEECANLVLEREQLRNQNLALLELVFKANTIAQQAEEASSRTQSGNDSILSGLGTTTATDGALAEFSSAPGEIPDTSMHTAISGLLGLNSNT